MGLELWGKIKAQVVDGSVPLQQRAGPGRRNLVHTPPPTVRHGCALRAGAPTGAPAGAANRLKPAFFRKNQAEGRRDRQNFTVRAIERARKVAATRRPSRHQSAVRRTLAGREVTCRGELPPLKKGDAAAAETPAQSGQPPFWWVRFFTGEKQSCSLRLSHAAARQFEQGAGRCGQLVTAGTSGQRPPLGKPARNQPR